MLPFSTNTEAHLSLPHNRLISARRPQLCRLHRWIGIQSGIQVDEGTSSVITPVKLTHRLGCATVINTVYSNERSYSSRYEAFYDLNTTCVRHHFLTLLHSTNVRRQHTNTARPKFTQMTVELASEHAGGQAAVEWKVLVM